jgi:hypothetical protein
VLGFALVAVAAACDRTSAPEVPAAAGPPTSAPATASSIASGGTAAKAKGKATGTAVQPATPELVATEILGRPTADGITVSVVPAAPMELWYEYGTAPGAPTARTAPQQVAAGVPVETQLTGLAAGTRYHYRLRHGSTVGPERSFTTQRRAGEPFTFAVQGDSHPERVGRQFDAALYERTLRSVAANQPDFFVCIGDDFSVDALKTVDADIVRSLYLRQRQWLSLVGAPLFLVNGNHEQAAKANLDGTPNNVAVWAQTSRNALFPQPAPDAFYGGNPEPVEFIGLLRNYFSFTWGDALIVVLDPYWHSATTVDNQYGVDREETKSRDLWNVTLGETQYRWFERTLRTSTARHKLVFAHHVNGTGRGGIELARSYEWGNAAQFPARRPGWGKPIHDLMVDNEVAVFFQGHDHIYVQQELDGVIYQTLPNPANPNYSLENASAFRSGVKLPNGGYLTVGVDPDAVSVRYIRTYLDRPDEVAHAYRVG